MGPIIKADMGRTRIGTIAGDERGIIIGWLGKLIIGFVIVGILIFDAGSILINFFTLDSTADDIARELVLTSSTTPGGLNDREIEAQAEELATAARAKLVSVELDSENNVVVVNLKRTADTLVVERVGWIDQWGEASSEGRHGTG